MIVKKKKKKWFKFGAKLLRFLCYLLEIISVNEKKSAINGMFFVFLTAYDFLEERYAKWILQHNRRYGDTI